MIFRSFCGNLTNPGLDTAQGLEGREVEGWEGEEGLEGQDWKRRLEDG